MMLFQTPTMYLFDKCPSGLPSSLCMLRITCPHRDVDSRFILHHHLTIRPKLRDLIDPTPSPPFSLEVRTLSHETQVVLLFQSLPPHRNLLWMDSSFSTTPFGTKKIERKYAGRFPTTDFKRINLPPKDSDLAFQEESLD